jgi:hypothetical protein
MTSNAAPHGFGRLRALARQAGAVLFVVVWQAGLACVAPPPRVAAVSAAGLSLRVHVFGASATEVNDAFVAANKTTPNFHVVHDGGDGDLVLGVENDSPMCVPPTGLCSFKISYRVLSNGGEALTANTTTITAQSDRCANLCTQAINNVVVKVIEDAATALAGVASDDTGGPKPPPKPHPTGSKAPPICAVASGPHLPTEDAEARAGQVEVLKRLGLLDQSEYDCLRKAYLGRL